MSNTDIDDALTEQLNNELADTTFTPTDFGLNLVKTDSSYDDDDFDKLLDSFIAKQLQDTIDTQEEVAEAIKNKKPASSVLMKDDETVKNLYTEERRLYDAYASFKEAVTSLAEKAQLQMPKLFFEPQMIYPRFRPSRGRTVSEDVINCWNLMLDAQPDRLSSLSASASDEDILLFAEKTTDEHLQLALISYVEILIELESCEVAYNLRKANAQKRKIERRIYEEQQQRLETKRKYIQAIKKKGFPIDAERLVNNFFKTARKDPDGARQILERNPATFAPIQTDKIKPRFFGLIKPKPEDGIRINKEIGRFLKNLKA